MGSEIFGLLSDKLDGTTISAQVINTCLSAGECPNKTPFIFQVSVTPVHSSPDFGGFALAD